MGKLVDLGGRYLALLWRFRQQRPVFTRATVPIIWPKSRQMVTMTNEPILGGSQLSVTLAAKGIQLQGWKEATKRLKVEEYILTILL